MSVSSHHIMHTARQSNLAPCIKRAFTSAKQWGLVEVRSHSIGFHSRLCSRHPLRCAQTSLFFIFIICQRTKSFALTRVLPGESQVHILVLLAPPLLSLLYEVHPLHYFYPAQICPYPTSVTHYLVYKILDFKTEDIRQTVLQMVTLCRMQSLSLLLTFIHSHIH